MPKLQANVARDRRNDRELEEMGWSVLRFWEHQPVEQMADRVVAIVEQLRLRDGKSQGLTGACVVAVNRRFARLSSAARILGAP